MGVRACLKMMSMASGERGLEWVERWLRMVDVGEVRRWYSSDFCEGLEGEGICGNQALGTGR